MYIQVSEKDNSHVSHGPATQQHKPLSIPRFGVLKAKNLGTLLLPRRKVFCLQTPALHHSVLHYVKSCQLVSCAIWQRQDCAHDNWTKS